MRKNHTYSSYFKNQKKQSILKSSFLMIAIILFIGNVRGQNKTIPSKKTVPSINKTTVVNKKTTYLTTSFDPNLTKIPIDFKGHNPIELYKSLRKKTTALSKGEFETTAQFEDRVKIENSKPILGILNEQSLFSFKSKESNLDHLSFSYDADNQLIELAIYCHTFFGENSQIDRSKKTIELNEIRIEKNSTIGTNAFGVSKEINSYTDDVYSLLIDNWRNFVNGGILDDLIKIKFKVNPVIAKQIKEVDLHYGGNGVLGFLYIGNIIKPFTYDGHYYSGAPTLSYPNRFTKNIYYINLKLNEIWIYNKITGEILTKIKPYKDMVCDIKYSLNDRKLVSGIPAFDLHTVTEKGVIKEGVITVNIRVNESGDRVFEDGIGTPTTIDDISLRFEAERYVRKLKFDKNTQSGYSHGTVTFTFKRDETN